MFPTHKSKWDVLPSAKNQLIMDMCRSFSKVLSGNTGSTIKTGSFPSYKPPLFLHVYGISQPNISVIFHSYHMTYPCYMPNKNPHSTLHLYGYGSIKNNHFQMNIHLFTSYFDHQWYTVLTHPRIGCSSINGIIWKNCL